MIDQLAIPTYLKHAKFTIILYDISDPNNRYWEANRFYQAINFGVSVITGCIESMAELVREHKIDISLTYDGRDLKEWKRLYPW
jgi:hypothetical protein